MKLIVCEASSFTLILGVKSCDWIEFSQCFTSIFFSIKIQPGAVICEESELIGDITIGIESKYKNLTF